MYEHANDLMYVFTSVYTWNQDANRNEKKNRMLTLTFSYLETIELIFFTFCVCFETQTLPLFASVFGVCLYIWYSLRWLSMMRKMLAVGILVHSGLCDFSLNIILLRYFANYILYLPCAVFTCFLKLLSIYLFSYCSLVIIYIYPVFLEIS